MVQTEKRKDEVGEAFKDCVVRRNLKQYVSVATRTKKVPFKDISFYRLGGQRFLIWNGMDEEMCRFCD